MDYREMIAFRRLKETIEEKGLRVRDVAEKIGVAPSVVSAVITGARLPKTDFLARICWAVGEGADSVCEFRGIEPTEFQREWFEGIGRVYAPCAEARGDVTYRPLRRVLDIYLEERNREGKARMSASDFFDKVEPPGRRSGAGARGRENIKAALEARGLSADGERKTGCPRGLPYQTRAKLRHDRPLNIRTIYEICRMLGCTPGYVVSYK